MIEQYNPPLKSPSPEAKRNYRQHISSGAELIKEGRFEESIKHWRQSGPAKEVGYYLGTPAGPVLDESPRNTARIESIANSLACRSWFMHHGRIDISPIIPPPKTITNDRNMQRLYHEAALLGMEEWTHGLQHLLNSPVAGYDNLEVDVAAFMDQLGVPMTPAFLRRYDRAYHLGKKDQGDDSLISNPAWRVGTFVRVPRSGRSTPQVNWQIKAFDHKNKIITVANLHESGGIEKNISTKALSEANPTGLHPFKTCKNIQEILFVTQNLGGVIGTTDYFSPKEIALAIRGVKDKTYKSDIIPRSGGLREQVKRILIKESQNISELLDYTDHFDGLYGSDGDYYSALKIRSLFSYLKKNSPGQLNIIPRGLGLRLKAKELFFPNL